MKGNLKRFAGRGALALLAVSAGIAYGCSDTGLKDDGSAVGAALERRAENSWGVGAKVSLKTDPSKNFFVKKLVEGSDWRRDIPYYQMIIDATNDSKPAWEAVQSICRSAFSNDDLRVTTRKETRNWLYGENIYDLFLTRKEPGRGSVTYNLAVYYYRNKLQSDALLINTEFFTVQEIRK